MDILVVTWQKKTDQNVDVNFLFQPLTVQTFGATSFSFHVSQSCIRNKINCLLYLNYCTSY